MQVNYFHTLTFGITIPLFTEKFYSVKGCLFQQNLTYDHLYHLKTKLRKITWQLHAALSVYPKIWGHWAFIYSSYCSYSSLIHNDVLATTRRKMIKLTELFKVHMTWKIFSAYLKDLSKYRRMASFFLNYLFSFQRYWRFSIMQIRSVMTSYCLQLKIVKCWKKQYL